MLFLLRICGISSTVWLHEVLSFINIQNKMTYPQSNKSRHLKITHIPSHKRAAIATHWNVRKKEKKKKKEKKNLNAFIQPVSSHEGQNWLLQQPAGLTPQIWNYLSPLDWTIFAKVNFVILPQMLLKTWVIKYIFKNC